MRTVFSLFLSALVLLLIVGTASCQPSTPTTSNKSIVVTYSVLGSIVKELVGDKANVTVLIPNGLDPHEWQPSAKDIEKINKADIVVENGLGLENGIEKTLDIARNNGVRFFTASDHITVRHVGAGEGIPTGDPDQAIGAADPHLWMDPISIKSIVTALVPELQKDFGLDVNVRAQSLANNLDTLDKQIADKVAIVTESNRKLVTGHESMGYFAQRYGFKVVGIIVPSLTSQAEISAGDLAALKTIIEENNVKAIFTELGTPAAVAKAIGSETGVKVVPLSTHLLPSDGSYFTFMRDVADTITNALK